MTPKKEKSHLRFQQINRLCDEVLRKLRTPAHGLVLIVCWRHADEYGRFQLSHTRIAESVGLGRRHVIDLMDDLESAQAIKVIRKGSGTSATRYRIQEPSLVVNCGSLLETRTKTPTPQKSSEL